MSSTARRLYECGPFILDPDNRLLTRNGEPIPLPPKAFETLLVLVQHRGDLLPKETLLKEVWPSTFVEENNLTQYISLLRKVLGDNADHQSYIETVPKLGYRFVAPVREVEPENGAVIWKRRVRAEVLVSQEQAPPATGLSPGVSAVPATSTHYVQQNQMWIASAVVLGVAALLFLAYRLFSNPPRHSAAVQKRLSVAVLGFKNLSSDPQTDWLSTALSEMLTSELSAGGQIRTVPREEVVRAKQDLKINETSTLSQATLGRVRKHLHADLTVSGAYLQLTAGADGQIRVDIQAQDTVSGETTGSITQVGKVSDLFEVVSHAGGQLRATLGARQASPEDEGETRAAQPSSTDAARLYSQGLAEMRAFDAAAAQKFFSDAVKIDPEFALGHSSLAAAWATLGYDENARKEAARALELANKLSRQDHLLIAGRYWEINRNWDKAVEAYQLLFTSYPDNVDYGLRLASAQTSAGKGRDALSTVASLRRLPPPMNEDPELDLAEALAAESLGDFKHELESAQAASRNGDLLGEKLVLARGRSKEAWALSRLGEVDKAIATLAQAKELFRSAGDRQGMASTLQITATVLSAKGDYRDAKQHAHEALQIFQQLGDKRGTAQCFNTLAVIHYEQGELNEAQSLFERALQIDREVGSRINTAGALGNIANVFEAKGELAEAQKLTEESIQVFSEAGDERARGTALGNLASLLFEQGHLARARASYEQALEIKRRIGYQRGIAYDLSGLSEILEAESDLRSARKDAEEALAIRQRIGEKHNAALSLLGLAQFSLDEARPVEAEKLAREAIIQFKSDESALDEAVAGTILARALVLQHRNADAEDAIIHAEALARGTENRPLRFELVAASVAVAAMSPQSRIRIDTLHERLKAALGEAHRCGYTRYELKLMLASLQLERMRGDVAVAKSQSRLLAQEAKAMGFRRIAENAEGSLGPTQ